MSEMTVEVPQRKLDELEHARKDLYQFITVELGITDIPSMIRLNNITGVMWELGNTKYPPSVAVLLTGESN